MELSFSIKINRICTISYWNTAHHKHRMTFQMMCRICIILYRVLMGSFLVYLYFIPSSNLPLVGIYAKLLHCQLWKLHLMQFMWNWWYEMSFMVIIIRDLRNVICYWYLIARCSVGIVCSINSNATISLDPASTLGCTMSWMKVENRFFCKLPFIILFSAWAIEVHVCIYIFFCKVPSHDEDKKANPFGRETLRD